MDVSQRVVTAIDQALAAASGGASASQVVSSALRVATLRQDPLAEFWLRIELEGMRQSKGTRATEALARLVALVGAERAEQQRVGVLEALMNRRSVQQDGKDAVTAHSVSELESHALSLQAIYDEPITSGMTPLDTGLASINRDKARGTLAPTLLQQKAVLARIRDAAYVYLVEAEADMIAGQPIPNVIAEGHAFVESRLSVRAPAALEALTAAQDRLLENSSEAMSHTATSCRRAIKALADVLYPPSAPIVDDAGVARILDDEHYRNRLVEFVRLRRGRSTHADLLASNVVALGARLKSLDDLASKGVHSDLTQGEAESCLSWTYMLAADLLRIDEQSAGD